MYLNKIKMIVGYMGCKWLELGAVFCLFGCYICVFFLLYLVYDIRLVLIR